MSEFKLFSSPHSSKLGDKIAATLKTPHYVLKTSEFSDGESRIEIDTNVRGVDVYLVHSTHAPVNTNMRGVRGEYAERIKPFIEWTDRNVEKFLWSEMHCYSETFWVGGISDCGALLKTGKTVIIDFKSSKEAYASHFFQIAGYDLQISENGGYDSEGNKIFTLENPIDGYIVIPFRSEDSVPGYDFDVDKNREAFKACLTLYKITEKI